MARFKFGKKKKGSDSSTNSITSDMTHQRELLDESQEYGMDRSPPSNKYSAMPVVHKPPKIAITATTPWKRFKLFESPFPRYRHAASSISSDKNEIFLMGGLKEGSVFGDTWKVHPQEDGSGEITSYAAQAVDIANLNTPPARVGHSAVLCGNAFIIYGGDTVDTDFNGYPDNNFYLFNINNSKYTIPGHILNKPNGRYGHTIGVIALNNNSSRLFLFGGQLENDVFNGLYYFELNTFKSSKAQWEMVEPLNNFKPPPLTNHSMSIYKSKIYIFGGVYNNERVSNDLWCYDAIVNKWSQIPTTGCIPAPVNEHSSCIVNDKLYIYGGNDFSGVIYETLHVLDLHTLVWSKLIEGADGPGPRCGHSMTYLQKFNKLVIMGGDKNDYITNDPNNYETYEEYNGEEIGTMIYELDVDLLEHFTSDTPATTVVNPKLSSKKAASSAKAVDSGEALKLGNERHARSYSAGPEDFKTPEASPSRHGSPKADKFVEVDIPPTRANTIIHDKNVAPTEPYAAPSIRELGYSEGQNYNSDSGAHTGKEALAAIATAGAVTAGGAAAGGMARRTSVTKVISDEPSASQIAAREISEAPVSNGQSANDSKVKQLIGELTNELTQLKISTKQQMQNATEQINQLEQENSSLQRTHQHDSEAYQKRLQEKDSLVNELRGVIDPNSIALNEDGSSKSVSNVSELSKYKLERLELNNKLLYLQQENTRLTDKFAHFEPFMNNQIGELSNFQKIIKVQEEKISKLSGQVKDQEELHKEISGWKSKCEDIRLEFENYKSIHTDDELSDGEDAPFTITDEPTNRSIISGATSSGRRSKKDISTQLESLVNLWQTKNSDYTARDIPSPASPAENNPFITQLQKQVDDLLRISKQNEIQSSTEINSLKSELTEKLNTLKSFEENYRDALQSVNNTSKALKMNQEESHKQKAMIEKLVNENKELTIFKSASKRHSSRNGTPLLENNPKLPGLIPEGNEEEDENESISNAHFNMRIKDLEADLYIIKQERNQLKDNVTTLQKQLYMSNN